MENDRYFPGFNYEGDTSYDLDFNRVSADRGAVAAGQDIHDSAINTGYFKGIQAGSGYVDASHAVLGDGNTSVQDSHLGALASNGGQAFNVPGNAVFGSGSLNDIHGPGQVAQGHSTITDVANHGAGNLNFGDGTLNDVTTHGSGPVSVDHSSANEVTASDHGQAVLGNGNKLTGDVSVDLHHNSGPTNLAIGDHNDQSALQDNSVRDSYNTHTETDDHSNHSINDSYNQKHISDSFNHSWDSHDTHSIDDSYNHPTTTTVSDSLNHSWDSHDTHSVDDSYNHPTYDSHDYTHTVDDSYNRSWDSHDTHSVDDSYNNTHTWDFMHH